MNTKKIIGTVLVVGAVQVLSTQAAFADASSHAGCIGIEASSISPPGSIDEFPGGMSELQASVHDLAKQLGVAPGAIISSVAHLHEGSHAACDEATE
jgi:hypothetical protein